MEGPRDLFPQLGFETAEYLVLWEKIVVQESLTLLRDNHLGP
jgi:hypothetical protein